MFIRKVLVGEKPDADLQQLVKWCRDLRKMRLSPAQVSAGAGSRSIFHTKRTRVSRIGIRCNFGRMLYRLAKFSKPSQIIELGTGSGLAAGFLSKGAPEAQVYTVEIDPARIKFASNALTQLQLENLHILQQDFDEYISRSGNISTPFLVFMDGNHRFEPTLKYFDFFASRADENSVIVLDDIHWSDEMERAWKMIRQDPRVVITVDLFFTGVVFFRSGIPRQDFIINF